MCPATAAEQQKRAADARAKKQAVERESQVQTQAAGGCRREDALWPPRFLRRSDAGFKGFKRGLLVPEFSPPP